ncbi:DUF421 domain-containing protein [Alkalihalobacillus pseudalcaliphilus]|uniref:DUF421 domain-containing protein n=1 Tax=Alkalihalobacillus pseudalcaliphilus TaxID=79884 RepID=UPI00064DDB43|nr:DUF421 domain-containing protein [Alkalihalobacillus pseudalcaliphilus]KMK76947.1 membrane protein [Alkalihalobacillus pseudalcaliphilus]
MSDHVEIIFRSFLAFVILLIGARILGKQTISQMNVLDFIIAISIGSITANIAFNLGIHIHHLVLAFAFFVVVSIVTSYGSLKSKSFRNFVTGNPTVVIQNGHLLEKNMKKAHYTLDDINQLLRDKDVFDIAEVNFAIVETNGKLTVQKNAAMRTVTKEDLNLITKNEQTLPIELIMDGKIVEKNLEENGLTRIWLKRELEQRHVKVEDVFYAVLSGKGKLFVDTYNNQIASPVDKEW